VGARTLDGVWREAGSPLVSFLKIDTEGGELDVLKGGGELLRASRPSILIEAKGSERLKQVDACLVPFAYEREHRRGFAVGNYLYRSA
jgi:Methyltransferase FkbM domain